MRNFVLASLFFGRKNVCNKVKIFNLQFPNSQALQLSDSLVDRKTDSCPEKSRNLGRMKKEGKGEEKGHNEKK